jgi:hypothetical protein
MYFAAAMHSRELLDAVAHFGVSQHVKSAVNRPVVIQNLNGSVAESAHGLIRDTLHWNTVASIVRIPRWKDDTQHDDLF